MGLIGAFIGGIIGLFIDSVYIIPGLQGAEPLGIVIVLILIPVAFGVVGHYFEEKRYPKPFR